MSKVNRTVTVVRNVPGCLTSNKKGIKTGETKTVVKRFFYNWEGWYKFTDGVSAPDIFFEKVTTAC